MLRQVVKRPHVLLAIYPQVGTKQQSGIDKSIFENDKTVFGPIFGKGRRSGIIAAMFSSILRAGCEEFMILYYKGNELFTARSYEKTWR